MEKRNQKRGCEGGGWEDGKNIPFVYLINSMTWQEKHHPARCRIKFIIC